MLSKSSELLLNSLTQYYHTNPEHMHILEDIIEGKYTISLRVIDWFITHYSKYNNILYWIDTKQDRLYETIKEIHPNLRKFHLYLEYRSQLKSYTKYFFDPFRRHDRISFIVKHKPRTVIETTVGQLNFFRWVFQNHILEYILKYQKDIELAMNQEYSKKKNNIIKPIRGQGKTIQNTFMQSQCFLRFD